MSAPFSTSFCAVVACPLKAAACSAVLPCVHPHVQAPSSACVTCAGPFGINLLVFCRGVCPLLQKEQDHLRVAAVRRRVQRRVFLQPHFRDKKLGFSTLKPQMITIEVTRELSERDQAWTLLRGFKEAYISVPPLQIRALVNQLHYFGKVARLA